jgi:hypothetical protein
VQEICKMRSKLKGLEHFSVGEACYVLGLAFIQANKKMLALKHLQKANDIVNKCQNILVDPELHEKIARAIEYLLEPSSPKSPQHSTTSS